MLKSGTLKLAGAGVTIASVLGLLGFGAMTAPASAAASAANMAGQPVSATVSCPSGNLCTFDSANFRGTHWFFAYNNRPHAKWFFVGNGANDKITSFINNRAWTSYFDKDCPASAQDGYALGGYENSNLSTSEWPNGTSANNSISAIGLGTNTGVHVPAHWHHCGGC
jgi:hypothetical protein